MKDTFEVRIEADGSIEAVYQDGLAEALGAKETAVQRASNVEWETIDGHSGWTVRSAVDRDVAIRLQPAPNKESSCFVGRYSEDGIAIFESREEALQQEVRLFWAFAAMLREECTTDDDTYCMKHHCGAIEEHCLKTDCPHCGGK